MVVALCFNLDKDTPVVWFSLLEDTLALLGLIDQYHTAIEVASVSPALYSGIIFVFYCTLLPSMLFALDIHN